VKAGSEVDYSLGGTAAFHACAGDVVPETSADGDLSVRFVYDPASCHTQFGGPVPAPSEGQTQTSKYAAAAGIPSTCSVTEDLSPNGEKFSCSETVTFKVASGFAVVYDQGKATGGQKVTTSVFSLYDERGG
jgi:hypothetical protein